MKFPQMLQLALVALVCCPVAGHAQNLTGSMGGTNFNLVVPDGFCITDAANSADTFFVNFISKLLENAKDKLIRVVVDCRELKARRANASTRIYNYVTYYFPIASENTKLSGDDLQVTRKVLCDELREQSDQTLKDVPDIVEKTAREMKQKSRVNSSKYLGVLAADPHGCYAGLLIGVADAKGDVSLVYTIVMRTAIRRKDLWMGFYSKYGSNADSARALQLAQTTAAALDAKNPE